MNSMLCSVGYQKFFDALPDYSFSLAEYLEKMHTALSYVAQEVSLGRVEYVVKMPAKLYIQEEETGLAVLYESPAGYGGGIYTETFFQRSRVKQRLLYIQSKTGVGRKQRGRVFAFWQGIFIC